MHAFVMIFGVAFLFHYHLALAWQLVNFL